MSIARILLTAGLLGAALNASAAVGTTETTNGVLSTQTGAITVTFDEPIPTGISYSGGYVASGTTGEYAAPPGSGGNYFTVGITSPQNTAGTVTFSGAGASYFGFYLGSPDTYNSVTFYGSDNSVTTYTGSDLVATRVPPLTADGNQANGFFFGATSSANTTFTKVVFTSTGNAMETDNHAFILAPVPEPETYAMLLAGLALVGVVGRRSKRQA